MLKEALSEKLLELMESGKLQALKNKWFSATKEHKEECGIIYSTGIYAVQIQNTYHSIMIECKSKLNVFLVACLHAKYSNIIYYYHNDI